MIPTDLVAIPPILRTVIYYVIAEAIIVCTAVTAGSAGWDLALQIASGNAILFFGTAAAKVSKKQDVAVVEDLGDVETVPEIGA